MNPSLQEFICKNPCEQGIYTDKSLKRGIYTDKSLKRGIHTDKSFIYNQIQFISHSLPCYIIKPSPDFQFVDIQQGC